jgi:biotin transport system substrate-specific component
MTSPAALPVTQRRRVLADLVPHSVAADIALVSGAALFVGLLAQVHIALGFTPVPITGQTLGVLLAGSALGWRRGSLAMALYVAAGIVGVPWYTDHAHGWAVATGATGGYLFGFIAAAAVCGVLAQQGNDRRILPAMGSMVVGNVVIYAVGVPWLAHYLHVSLSKGVALGLTPFLLGDVVKVLLAAMILPASWKLVDRARRHGDA